MRYHWVSQNKTGNHEIPGGYIWCPKLNRNGAQNPNYEMMRNVEPGDVLFSFQGRTITHVGVIVSHAFDAQKPADFGASGRDWDDIGWKVLVEYESVGVGFMPAMHMDTLLPLLPKKYSPIQEDGRGNQMYFTTIPNELGEELVKLAGLEHSNIEALIEMARPAIERSDSRIGYESELSLRAIEDRINQLDIPSTEKLALISSRVGQGEFRQRVLAIEPNCRVTLVNDPRFLRASHIKPWRDANNQERLDGNNGLMLTPTVDLLFDQGYISFDHSGGIVHSAFITDRVWAELHLPQRPEPHKPFNAEQRGYLEYHRDVVLRKLT